MIDSTPSGAPPTGAAPHGARPTDARPAPGSTEKLERLKALLREMFQLDRGDLDFGLYRIMNLKTAEVAAFLDRDLLPQVKTKLNLTSAEERARLEKEQEKTRQTAWEIGVDPDLASSPKLVELQRRLSEMKKDADAEADVYNHLVNFFTRYYTEGDFISQRRYSSGGRPAYLIPYDGEEVKLHWANADQYYVKTTENYASYAFTTNSGSAVRRVRFEIAAADNEKDNVKETNGRQRRFVLAAGGNAVAIEGGELAVRFEHRPLTEGEKKRWPGNGGSQQGRINETTSEGILSAADAVDPGWRAALEAPAPTNANGERTLLAKHVDRYTAKNSFDYFIHKDLGSFLRRELDLYLNTQVLNLDDLERGDAARLDRALARVRAIRHIGGKIIDFLAQLEDFQKQLWLKKKFVLETNWSVTLDRVPETLYPEIAANRAQCEEWVELFAVDEIEGDLTNGGVAWSDPPTIDFLEANPCLVLDTRHFERDFTDRLLAALSDAGPLDDQTDGLLVHGENFQALKLLQARYRGQVQCVYIDPPYNTNGDGFVYRDSYQHSSWLSMLKNRLSIARELLSGDGIFFSSINDIEQPLLRLLLDERFGTANRIANMVWKGATDNNPTRIATEHEYLIWYAKDISSTAPVWKSPVSDAKNLMLEEWERLRASCRGLAEVQARFRKFIRDNREALSPLTHYDRVDEDGPYTGGRRVHNPGKEGYRYDVIHPRTGKPCVQPARGYRFPQETMLKLLENDKIIFGADETQIIQIKEYLHDYDGGLKGLVELDSRVGANALESLFGSREVFKNPKPTELLSNLLSFVTGTNRHVLDFLAGSGTTGHAVIDLNRGDGGHRRYLLVEVGHHFDTVLIPRMKKIVYSPDWKGGKPISRKGVSQLFKYIRLESYEDAMDSLVVVPPSQAQVDVLESNPTLAEDYRLRYALGVETSGSASLLGKDFADPFAYTLSVVRDGVRNDNAHVDLPETFNYLIGLRVGSRRRIDGVLTITGMDTEGRHCLILWRNLHEIDCAALDAWFDRNRKRFDGPLDVIYVNGDHTLNAMRRPRETWIAETIEPVFRERMFEGDPDAAAAR